MKFLENFGKIDFVGGSNEPNNLEKRSGFWMANEITQQFNEKVIKRIGEIPLSNTQEIRVALISDEVESVLVSVQKWWRANDKDDWRIGKGFALTPKDAEVLKRLISQSKLAL